MVDFDSIDSFNAKQNYRHAILETCVSADAPRGRDDILRRSGKVNKYQLRRLSNRTLDSVFFGPGRVNPITVRFQKKLEAVPNFFYVVHHQDGRTVVVSHSHEGGPVIRRERIPMRLLCNDTARLSVR